MCFFCTHAACSVRLTNRPWCRHQSDALHFIDAMLHSMEQIAQVWHMMRDIRMLGATCAHGNVAFGCLHTTLQIAFAPYHGQCAVMQGMGEPLNNYNEVSSAVKMMVDPQIFALRRSAVTVSTVGVIPRMLQMMEDLPGVSLALSLHAPTQELRKTIVCPMRACCSARQITL